MFKHFLIDSKDFDGPVLVTGAGGCIGSWVLTLLTKSEIPVVAFDISDNKNRLKLLMSNENIAKIKSSGETSSWLLYLQYLVR